MLGYPDGFGRDGCGIGPAAGDVFEDPEKHLILSAMASLGIVIVEFDDGINLAANPISSHHDQNPIGVWNLSSRVRGAGCSRLLIQASRQDIRTPSGFRRLHDVPSRR